MGTLSGHSNAVSSVRLNEKIVCSGSHDKTVKLWDKKTSNVQ